LYVVVDDDEALTGTFERLVLVLRQQTRRRLLQAGEDQSVQPLAHLTHGAEFQRAHSVNDRKRHDRAGSRA
jgi:gamma-glutamyl:cysteine ligase YbdK (ATP-grasp superfamily)